MRSRVIRTLAIFSLAVFAACGGSSDSATEDTGAIGSTATSAQIVFLQAEGEFFVTGVVFNDINGDGIMSTCEPGIEGVTVEIETALGQFLDGAVTNELGLYALTLTAAGDYRIVETDLSGYASSVNSVDLVGLTGNATVDFADETEVPSYSICGVVFEDRDGNGVMDSDNIGMPGVTVTLTYGQDAAVGEIATGDAGIYAFAVTTEGSYAAKVTEPEGYRLTTVSPLGVDVPPGDLEADFGLQSYVDVYVDIKPCNEANPVNLKSQGVLPTAILGSVEFDVENIDPQTILLEGVAPARANTGYVCGDEECEEGEIGDDGFLDLLLKFDTPALADTLMAQYPDLARGDIVPLGFTGSLYDGTALAADPAIRILIVQVPKE
ncbi:MAG: hypothetical protein JXR72_00450 [Proteobacteria bacterium]|nr:hypothetical protein [Pseudomonadota bacterium]